MQAAQRTATPSSPLQPVASQLQRSHSALLRDRRIQPMIWHHQMPIKGEVLLFFFLPLKKSKRNVRPFFPPLELCHRGFRDKALFVFPSFKLFFFFFCLRAILKEIEPAFQFTRGGCKNFIKQTCVGLIRWSVWHYYYSVRVKALRWVTVFGITTSRVSIFLVTLVPWPDAHCFQ